MVQREEGERLNTYLIYKDGKYKFRIIAPNAKIMDLEVRKRGVKPPYDFEIKKTWRPQNEDLD